MPQKDIHTPGKALFKFFRSGTFVVRANHRGGVGAQVFAAYAGAVAVDNFAFVQGQNNFIQGAVFGGYDAGVIHHLAKAKNTAVLQGGLKVGSIEDSA